MQIGLRSGIAMFGLLGLAGTALLAETAEPAAAQAAAKPTTAAPLPGANSFVESQARKRLEASGFTDVSPLVNDSLGVWTGTAKSGSSKVRVTVDFKGNVSANPE